MAANININNTYSIANKYGLLQLDDNDFEHWKHELEMWQVVTDLAVEKQGPVIYLSLSGKARQACASLTKEQLNVQTGVETLLTKLSELYAKDKDQATYQAYEKFETFCRKSTMNIRDYINEFDRLNNRLIGFNIVLPDAVLAYQLLKNANLPADKRNLIRATVSTLTLDDMKKQIKAISDHCAIGDSESSSMSIKDELSIKVEPESVYYENSGRRGKYRGKGYSRGSFRGYNRGYGSSKSEHFNMDEKSNQNKKTARVTNPVDSYTGRPSKCNICESIFHWAADCPDSHENRTKLVHIQLLTKNIKNEHLAVFVSETLNSALLDSGCSSTVCGENWLKCYLDTLENPDIQRSLSSNQFRFGDGKVFMSKGKVNLPATIGDKDVHILTDIVDCEIPLLLSKNSMKAANTKLDFVSDSVNMYGKDIVLNITANGHYCIPISTKHSILNKSQNHVYFNANVNLTINNLEQKSTKEKESIALKLHKQFGHPLDSEKLKNLLHDAKIYDLELEKAIVKITDNCDTCSRYKKARSRPDR